MRLPLQGAALHLNRAEFSCVFSLAVAYSFFLGRLHSKYRVGARAGQCFLCLPRLNAVRACGNGKAAGSCLKKKNHQQVIVFPSKQSRPLFLDLDSVSKHTLPA